MKKSSLSYKTALFLALGISLLMNLLFLIMFFYGRDAVIPPEAGAPAKLTLRTNIMLMHVLFNFLMAFLLYLVNFRFLKKNNRLTVQNTLYIILATLVCMAVLSYIFSSIQIHFQEFGPRPNPAKFIRGGMFRDSFIAVVVMLSSLVIFFSEKQRHTALENESLQAENMRTRFLALKNQVDPHFLFNSLNTLNSLIKIDTGKAQDYVQQLSYVFRYTLQNKEVITLEEELKFTQAYCHLMQIRYGDSLQFMQLIDEKYFSYLVIPLSLQTLVENAIKHNVVSNKQPLTITIASRENATMSVSNPIQPKKEMESGEGIGLANLVERYRLMWKKEILVNKNDERFEVVIPLVEKI